MSTDGFSIFTERLERLERENRELKETLTELQSQIRQRELDSAYIYIHSNWQWVRWTLTRDRDLSGAETPRVQRSRAAETSLQGELPRYLRSVQFDPHPMEAAHRWRIAATVILNRHGYTFFD